MAWTTPRTWAVGELATAANLNTHIRDNLSFLYDASYGLLIGSRTTLASPAASIGVTGLQTVAWKVIRIIACLRGTNASTNDSFKLQLGGAALDTTVGNYYGHNVTHAGTVPTVTAFENLGATAGIFHSVFFPGNTATASYFSFFECTIVNGNQSAEYKRGLFQNSYQVLNTTGSVGSQRGGGKWLNVANTLQQISLIPASGSNLATGCWLAVYGGWS